MTPEQLKASILKYAMQGKLVEQKPEDGTGEDDDPFDTFLHIDIEAIRKEYLSAFQTPESTEAVVDGVKSLLGNILSEEQAAQFTVENVTNALSHGLTESFLNAALSQTSGCR